MKSSHLALACAALLVLATVPAGAQLKLPAQKPVPAKPQAATPAAKPAPSAAAAETPLGRQISEWFKKSGGRTLCIAEDTPISEMITEVIDEAKRRGAGDSLTLEQAELALHTRYPCPFSPFRNELRPATVKEVEGVWLFPEGSQPYRYGPKSHNQPGGPALAIRCEIVGYYPGGELRTGLVRGEEACPFQKAADLEPARTRPRVAAWQLLRDGRVKVTRGDVPNHLEEWDVYIVTRAFGMHAMDFKEGDLVAFLRLEPGNDINAATEFRHLQRLP